MQSDDKENFFVLFHGGENLSTQIIASLLFTGLLAVFPLRSFRFVGFLGFLLTFLLSIGASLAVIVQREDLL